MEDNIIIKQRKSFHVTYIAESRLPLGQCICHCTIYAGAKLYTRVAKKTREGEIEGRESEG